MRAFRSRGARENAQGYNAGGAKLYANSRARSMSRLPRTPYDIFAFAEMLKKGDRKLSDTHSRDYKFYIKLCIVKIKAERFGNWNSIDQS